MLRGEAWNHTFICGGNVGMGVELYATKWAKYSALLLWNATQNTATTHNNKPELLQPYPSADVAQTWRHCSLWICQWRVVSSALLPLLVPSFVVLKCIPSNIREKGMALA
jgi:hypothetical protein